jgi:hypothetical protein
MHKRVANIGIPVGSYALIVTTLPETIIFPDLSMLGTVNGAGTLPRVITSPERILLGSGAGIEIASSIVASIGRPRECVLHVPSSEAHRPRATPQAIGDSNNPATGPKWVANETIV